MAKSFNPVGLENYGNRRYGKNKDLKKEDKEPTDKKEPVKKDPLISIKPFEPAIRIKSLVDNNTRVLYDFLDNVLHSLDRFRSFRDELVKDSKTYYNLKTKEGNYIGNECLTFVHKCDVELKDAIIIRKLIEKANLEVADDK